MADVLILIDQQKAMAHPKLTLALLDGEYANVTTVEAILAG